MKRPIKTTYFNGRKIVSRGHAGTVVNARIAVARNLSRIRLTAAEIYDQRGRLKVSVYMSKDRVVFHAV